jgi:hypothetical protein
MWLFTTDGFFSAVEHKDDASVIVVRARVREDLERLIARLPLTSQAYAPKIVTLPWADYAHRIALPRHLWAAYVGEAIADLHYTNFKQAALTPGTARAQAYHLIWHRLAQWQVEEGMEWPHWPREQDLPEDVIDDDLLGKLATGDWLYLGDDPPPDDEE